MYEDGIPIDSISKLYDSELNDYFEKNLATLSTEIKDRIMKLDIPLEDKIYIIEEFQNLPEKLQKEFLEELKGEE